MAFDILALVDKIKKSVGSAVVATEGDEQKQFLTEAKADLDSLPAAFAEAGNTVSEEMTQKIADLEAKAIEDAATIKALQDAEAEATTTAEDLATQNASVVQGLEDQILTLESDKSTLEAANEKLSEGTKQVKKEIKTRVTEGDLVPEEDPTGEKLWDSTKDMVGDED